MSPEPPIDAHYARWLRDPAEPLALRSREGRDGPWRPLEFTCRGDRVSARVASAGADTARPLALVVDLDADAVVALPGLVTACLDLPLLGARRSPKWTERLSGCLADGPADPVGRALLDEFLGQAVRDLMRLVDVCTALPEVDSDRVGIAGVGPGALAAAVASALDARLGSVVLAPGALASALDPAATLAQAGARCRVLGSGEEGDRAHAWARLAGGSPLVGDGLDAGRELAALLG